MTTLTLTIADLEAPAFHDLVARHSAFCDRTAPPESCHRLPVEGLKVPGVTVWTAQDETGLLAMGALKELTPRSGEIKSMHTTEAARGRGLGRRMLAQIMATARARGYGSLWLETGVHPLFAPARALYAAHGFTECPPFGAYRPDPHSIFMTCTLPQQDPSR